MSYTLTAMDLRVWTGMQAHRQCYQYVIRYVSTIRNLITFDSVDNMYCDFYCYTRRVLLQTRLSISLRIRKAAKMRPNYLHRRRRPLCRLVLESPPYFLQEICLPRYPTPSHLLRELISHQKQPIIARW